MTQSNHVPTKVVQLPSPQFPMLTRVVSDPIFSQREEAMTWAIGAAHPLVPETYKVIRMFADRGGVEIYSVSSDGKNGMRNLIPTDKVRFIEEAMPLDVFGDELYAAEGAAAPVGPLSVESEDDDEPEPAEPDFLDDEPAPENGSTPITS